MIRVLLVEDNEADIFTIQTLLADSKMHVDLTIARTGELALELLHGEDIILTTLPDLILLDLKLPGLQGRDVLTQIRVHDRTNRIPVIILTSSDDEGDIWSSYEKHANAYVRKPLGLEAFRRVVDVIDEFWFTIVKLPKTVDGD